MCVCVCKLSKLEIEGNHLNLVKSCYQKPVIHIYLNGKILEIFPVKSDRTVLPTITASIYNCLRHHRNRRKISGVMVGTGEPSPLLFADDMVLYIETLKESKDRKLDITREFNKVTRHKIDIKNQLLFSTLTNVRAACSV